jgi:hypothetical protein
MSVISILDDMKGLMSQQLTLYKCPHGVTFTFYLPCLGLHVSVLLIFSFLYYNYKGPIYVLLGEFTIIFEILCNLSLPIKKVCVRCTMV